MDRRQVSTEEREGGEFRSGFITLVGRPNVGKSTLMNQLIGQKVAITSEKPQTTRGRLLTVYTDAEAQLIFLDTPGIIESRNKLGDHMMRVARSSLEEPDLILYLIEPDPFIGRGEERVLLELERARCPVLLVINKEDTVEESRIRRVKEAYQSRFSFAALCSVSARKRTGLDRLLREIKDRLPYGPAYYEEDVLTEVPERELVGEIIREKALRLLSEEVPHGIAVTVEKMRDRTGPSGSSDKGLTDIHASIICERDSHKGIIIGRGGSMLRKIGTAARRDMEVMLERPVNLQLFVKVRKDWRNDPGQLGSLGYRMKK